MKRSIITLLFSGLILIANAQESDIFKTSRGDLKITFIGHGTIMFEYNNMVIHVDPYSKIADYTKLPKADLILITHHHGDHLDSAALASIYKDNTEIFWTQLCQVNSKFKKTARVIGNGGLFDFQGIKIEAVPAYNIVNKRQNGQPFHPQGEGNGYILNFGDKRVYVAGDTENIPEMKEFGKIDVAFLPMNLPYTMTPEMVKDAVLMIKPTILYPYHFGKTDTNIIVELLKANPEVEVRIRKME